MIRRIVLPIFLLSAFQAMPAVAHAMLERQSPSAGAVLAAPPAAIRLSFSERLEPVLSGISLAGAGGHSVAAAPPEIDGQTMTLRLTKLPPGKYHVSWHAVSVDTHRTEGGYDFTVTH